NPGFVADLIGERRLEHAAVDWLRITHRLASRDVDEIDAHLSKCARNFDRIVTGDAALGPVGGGNAHRHRLARRPDRPHGLEPLERETKTVLQGPAIYIRSMIGQW